MSSPARLCAIPGRRSIRSHSLGQSEAAAQETAPKIQPQGQRPGRSAFHHRQQSSVSHHTSTAVFVRAIATKHRNHVPFPYVPRINTTFNRCRNHPGTAGPLGRNAIFWGLHLARRCAVGQAMGTHCRLGRNGPRIWVGEPCNFRVSSCFSWLTRLERRVACFIATKRHKKTQRSTKNVPADSGQNVDQDY